MKTSLLAFFALLYNLPLIGQDLNGVYKTNYTSFENKLEPGKNFFEQSHDIIVIDVSDYPRSKGTIVISSNSEGETVNMKLEVVGTKEVDYDSGETYITYDCKMLLLNHEDKRRYTISFIWDGVLKSIILFYSNTSHQMWSINSKL